MVNRIINLALLLLVMVAAAGPDVAAAVMDPLASPTPQPIFRITAPEIIGIYPVVVMSEGNQGDTHPSDIFISGQILTQIVLRVLVTGKIFRDGKSTEIEVGAYNCVT